MKTFFQRYPLFIFLLPAFVTIHLEKEFHNLIEYRFAYDRILIFFATPLLLFLIFRLIIKETNKAALATLVISLFFFYTGEIRNWLMHLFPEAIWHRYSFLIPAILVLVIFFIYKIIRSKSNFKIAFYIINTAIVLFIAADIATMLIKQQQKGYQAEETTANERLKCDTCIKPDIYYIVVDNYDAPASLISEFSFNNNAIESYLETKGFKILDQSMSNYSYTSYSIGSILNMSYIKDVDTTRLLSDRTYLQALKLVYDNRVIRLLSNEGYRIFNHSLFRLKSHPTTITGFDNWGFRETFDQHNLVLKLNHDMGYHLPAWLQNIVGTNKYFINDPQNRKAIDEVTEQHLLNTIRIQTKEPKFVYAHFLRTHPPFHIDSAGNTFKHNTGLKEAYIHQVIYCNKMIKRVTDSIFNNNKRPFVIIIQSDHGYNPDRDRNIQKHLSAFNAVYFYNKDYREYDKQFSNVNTFRIFFNTFFKMEYPILENRSYVFRSQ